MKYDYEDQFVEALKGITDNNLKKKLVAIKKLVCERMSLEKDFKREHNKLEYKYEQLYKPFYERRQKIIEGEEKPDIDQIKDKLAELKIDEEQAKAEKENEKGIPEFWYKCLENCQDIMINDKDKNILKKLKLIKCTPEENGNFTLEFFFEPNDYFTNEVLKREFILDEDYDIKEIKSDEIQWKSDEVNPTIEIKQKKVKNKRTKQIKTVQKKEKIPSFFSSFRNFVKKEGDKPKDDDKDEDDDEDEGDEMTIEDEYDQALQFKEEIIPYAIEYYLGIADDEEDDLGGEEDEEEEEEEEEEKPKPRGGKKGGYQRGRKKY
jgi:nucleosome assembly protein 1-like 1